MDRAKWAFGFKIWAKSEFGNMGGGGGGGGGGGIRKETCLFDTIGGESWSVSFVSLLVGDEDDDVLFFDSPTFLSFTFANEKANSLSFKGIWVRGDGIVAVCSLDELESFEVFRDVSRGGGGGDGDCDLRLVNSIEIVFVGSGGGGGGGGGGDNNSLAVGGEYLKLEGIIIWFWFDLISLSFSLICA